MTPVPIIAMRRTGLLNGTDAPCVLARSFCRPHADVRRGASAAIVEKSEGDRVSGVTCSVEPAGALAAAPADWHHQSGLRGNRAILGSEHVPRRNVEITSWSGKASNVQHSGDV